MATELDNIEYWCNKCKKKVKGLKRGKCPICGNSITR